MLPLPHDQTVELGRVILGCGGTNGTDMHLAAQCYFLHASDPGGMKLSRLQDKALHRALIAPFSTPLTTHTRYYNPYGYCGFKGWPTRAVFLLGWGPGPMQSLGRKSHFPRRQEAFLGNVGFLRPGPTAPKVSICLQAQTSAMNIFRPS